MRQVPHRDRARTTAPLPLLLAVAVALPAIAGDLDLDKPIPVEECVRIALERSHDVLIAGDELDRARGNARQALGGVLPHVSSTATYSFDSTEGPAIVSQQLTTGETDADTRVLNLQLDQTLLDWSSLETLRGARRAADASREDVLNAELDVALAVKIRYYELLKAVRLDEVRRESVALRDQQLERAQTLFDVGSVARSDVLQARVNLHQSRLEAIQARNLVELERSRLAQLMGLPVDTRLRIVDNLQVTRIAAVDSAAVLEEARRRRPDLLAGRLRVSAGAANLGSARADRYPHLFARLSRTWIDQHSRRQVGDLPRVDSETLTKRWAVVAGISLNLFDGMVTEGRVKQAQAELRLQENRLRQLELAAALEVKEATLGIREGRQSIAAADQAVSLAEQNVRLAEERYQLGAGTLLELEEAQVGLIDSRRSLVEAQALLKVAEARLERARGGPVR